jgi:hypothetical protein
MGCLFACKILEAMWILKVNTVKKRRSGLEKLVMESSKNSNGGQK